MAKQPGSRELPSGRPGTTASVAAQYTPHSHQFPRTRKMFDKGPDQVRSLQGQAHAETPRGHVQLAPRPALGLLGPYR